MCAAKTINGQDVDMALWLAVQELKANNDNLTKENSALKSELSDIKSRLAALEGKD